MDSFGDILRRADIQSVREYIMNGVGDGEPDPRPYGERQREAEAPMREYLKSTYPDERERAAAWEQILPAITGNQEIYMEVGMIAGARLCYQLLVVDPPKE